MAAVRAKAEAVSAWLADREQAMIDLLGELVNVDSGSYNKAGVDAAGAVLERFWREHGLAVRRERSESYGDALFAELSAPEAANQRPVLLLGHRDTVFPDGEVGRRPFRVEGGRGYGPGVADMKSGVVIEAFVLAAFASNGGVGAPVTMLTTSDEEIASPFSRPVIELAARGARFCCNAEPSRTDPKAGSSNLQTQIITRQRKGGVFMRAEAIGKAAHSGARYQEGRSAILDLAQKVAPLHALTDLDAGITVNVGLIGGGQTVNTIAPNAWFEIDLRYVERAQREAAVSAIRRIVETPAVNGVGAKLEIKGEFLPLVETEESRRLTEAYRNAAASLGIRVTTQMTGGCADSGFTAAMGCPTLCSIGPMGGGGHTPDEFVEIASLVPAAQSLALAILDLVERG